MQLYFHLKPIMRHTVSHDHKQICLSHVIEYMSSAYIATKNYGILFSQTIKSANN